MGVFLVTASAATVAVVAGALLVISGRPGSTSDPLGVAISQLSAGKTGTALVAERQKVIVTDFATQSFSVESAAKISSKPPPQPVAPALPVTAPPVDPASARGIAFGLLSTFGFSSAQWGSLDMLWNRESGWQWNAANPSGAYGIPQALPGSKMANPPGGPDWQTNPTTQIKWGLQYIKNTYGTPANAWTHEVNFGWY
ncbi:MAG: lytic transglycosylase domain-containing protein [Actinobacteria bacterium]|nr:lytic transglycosylase domain-containing protein [Actinomycetota bacterium]MBO0830558.1 lytic transglycosylase domain-containing protein [Actinomycetota bacterium]MBO0835128.1 lytic transglycosylase domain-containing protein [Actinomycetota bacterium]